jgi:hypothetical protein
VTVDEWLRERTKGLAHSGRRCYRTCQSRRAPHQPLGCASNYSALLLIEGNGHKFTAVAKQNVVGGNDGRV